MIKKSAMIRHVRGENNIGEQGLSSSFIWKLIVTLISSILVLSYFVAG